MLIIKLSGQNLICKMSDQKEDVSCQERNIFILALWYIFFINLKINVARSYWLDEDKTEQTIFFIF